MQKRAGISILISDEIDFKPKTVTGDKGPYTILKGEIPQETILSINIYTFNIRADIYIYIYKAYICKYIFIRPFPLYFIYIYIYSKH